MVEHIRQEIKLKFQKRSDYIKTRILIEKYYNYIDDDNYPIIRYNVISSKGFFKRNKNYIIGGLIGLVSGLFVRFLLSL